MGDTSVVVVQKAGSIECDFEKYKRYLVGRLEEYKNAVFTEESKTVAKKVVASLRSEKKDFSDRIREVKAEYMKPFTEFELKAKELVSLYDEPIDFISDQVNAFEENRKAEKREKIKEIYKKCIGELNDYLPLAKIYNKRWENATYTEKSIEEDLKKVVSYTEKAIEIIRGMKSEAIDVALTIYKEDLNLEKALYYISKYESQKLEILRKEFEKQKLEESDRIRMEERERLEEQQKAETEKQETIEKVKEETKQEVVESLIPCMEGKSSLYEYRMSLTKDAKEKLEMYMDSIGIEWELI